MGVPKNGWFVMENPIQIRRIIELYTHGVLDNIVI